MFASESAQCALYEQAGRSALNWASWKGHTDIVHLLLGYKADVNAKGVVSECVTRLVPGVRK